MPLLVGVIRCVGAVLCCAVLCCVVQVLGVAKLGLAVIATFVVCWSPWLYSLDSAAQVRPDQASTAANRARVVTTELQLQCILSCVKVP
jgi:hypothetical protein